MGWLGIELSMVTSLIASIAIGLAVDDTIHYLARYNQEFRKDLDEERAIRDTLHHVGRPITFTTITICVGFSVLIFSSFKPTAIFGVMMVITSLSALVADLILLPSLIRHVELVTLWDLMRLKLGEEPRTGIPLFKGLSRTQIHYILMAGSLTKIDAGEVLFQKGDSSNSMYTIVSGEVDVYDLVRNGESDQHSENRILINQCMSGDVLGEMGFLRSAPRSATVIATTPVELLKINWKLIKRLQWLYPPTAQKFFLNLMGMVCDRLESLTECFAEIKVQDDVRDLCSKGKFTEILDTEIKRSRSQGTRLSLCFMKLSFENNAPSNPLKERIISSLGEAYAKEIRSWDTLCRYGDKTFAVLLPQITVDQAKRLCNRLQHISEENQVEAGDCRVKLAFGLAELALDSEENGADLIERAIAQF
jgi:CRP-like cAMP-binding protein